MNSVISLYVSTLYEYVMLYIENYRVINVIMYYTCRFTCIPKWLYMLVQMIHNNNYTDLFDKIIDVGMLNLPNYKTS